MTEEHFVRIPEQEISLDNALDMTSKSGRKGQTPKEYIQGAARRGQELDTYLLNPDYEVFILKRSTQEVFHLGADSDTDGLAITPLQTGYEFGGHENITRFVPPKE